MWRFPFNVLLTCGFLHRIETFLHNRDKCCFDLHVGRFIAALARPPTDPQAPHPALVQSILLMGCYFSRSPALADYEVRFLAQSRQELSASLAGPETLHEKLHDYIRASNLVAFFYFCKGNDSRLPLAFDVN